jgi:hypothetical protein
MFSYSGLPARVRRIAQQYNHCIEKVETRDHCTAFHLKNGYQTLTGDSVVSTADLSEAIETLKKVVKPATRTMIVALYSFQCPICSRQVHRGSNYVDLGGLKLCTMCGLPDRL